MKQRIDSICKAVDICGTYHLKLREWGELTVYFPVKMDDGTTQVFTDYWVQHDITHGLTKSEFCYHSMLTWTRYKGYGRMDEVKGGCGEHAL
ncbi:hypothetical protein ACFLS8_03615 [Chloroflexota bacterium]